VPPRSLWSTAQLRRSGPSSGPPFVGSFWALVWSSCRAERPQEALFRPGPLGTRCAAAHLISPAHLLTATNSQTHFSPYYTFNNCALRRPLVHASPSKRTFHAVVGYRCLLPAQRASTSLSPQACAVCTTSTLAAAARGSRFANATRLKKVVWNALTLHNVRMATKKPLRCARSARRATNDPPPRWQPLLVLLPGTS